LYSKAHKLLSPLGVGLRQWFIFPPAKCSSMCALEYPLLLGDMTGLIPCPGVLLPALPPPDSCILSARLQLIIVCCQVYVTWPYRTYFNTCLKQKTLGLSILGSLKFVVSFDYSLPTSPRTLRMCS